MAVYETDPGQAGDDGFVTAGLAHLVVGNRGRLLDARRTPVVVVASEPDRGSFAVQIEAFEDQGARWELGLEQIARFQFAREAQLASAQAVADLRAARDRFDQDLVIEANAAAGPSTAARIVDEQRRAVDAISARELPSSFDLADHIRSRRGNRQLMGLLEGFLAERDLLELDRQLARAFVSNPNAGELVKGHAIVLAELGLCRFSGKVPRDPSLLEAPWSRERRAQHLIARLAFARAMSVALSIDTVTLYRGAAADAPFGPPAPKSFVSATFSAAVAEAHFAGGPTTVAAVMWRQRLPAERLFMSFLETPALNERFVEAEAILVGDPTNAAF